MTIIERVAAQYGVAPDDLLNEMESFIQTFGLHFTMEEFIQSCAEEAVIHGKSRTLRVVPSGVFLRFEKR